jgi:hypothetical protein
VHRADEAVAGVSADAGGGTRAVTSSGTGVAARGNGGLLRRSEPVLSSERGEEQLRARLRARGGPAVRTTGRGPSPRLPAPVDTQSRCPHAPAVRSFTSPRIGAGWSGLGVTGPGPRAGRAAGPGDDGRPNRCRATAVRPHRGHGQAGCSPDGRHDVARSGAAGGPGRARAAGPVRLRRADLRFHGQRSGAAAARSARSPAARARFRRPRRRRAQLAESGPYASFLAPRPPPCARSARGSASPRCWPSTPDRPGHGPARPAAAPSPPRRADAGCRQSPSTAVRPKPTP